MSILFKIYLILIFFTPAIFSQEKNDSIKIYSEPVNPLQNIQAKFEEFEFYRDVNYLKHNVPLNDDPATIKLWTSAVLSKTIKSVEAVAVFEIHIERKAEATINPG